jgi:3-hydroxyacyl-CoA dehydrogenase
MGSGIAQTIAQAGYPVVCSDLDQEVIDRARAGVTSGRYGFDRAVERGKITREEADAALSRLQFSTDLEQVANTDLVVECVPERLDLKIRVFRDLDRLAKPSTILASNTSGFPIAALAAATERPALVVGWHWASPPPVMRFAEIVVTQETDDATRDAVCEVASRCGKNPIVIKDFPTAWGFVANRIYGAMIREAVQVVDAGIATHAEVNQLMVDCFNWPVGPFAMIKGATEGWKE